MTKVKLGQKVKDKITGFEGIVMATAQWLTGCDQCIVRPQMLKDGKTIESEWFDEARLEVIEGGIDIKDLRSDESGGPQHDIPR